MKKVLQLIILIFITNNFLSAQYIPLVEEGKYWVYLRYSNPDFPSGESGSAISFGGDTLINGLSYKKVYNHTLAGDYDYNYSGWTFTYPYQTVNKGITSFIREDTTNRKVYHLPISGINFCDAEEYLLFDFSLNVGDTLNDCVYESIWSSQTGLYPGGIVDSIKMIETQGKLRNAIYTFGFYTTVGLPYETELAIAEGVGFKDFGIFYRQQSAFVDYCEGGIEECSLIVSNKSVENSEEIKIYPNPSDGVFHVSIQKEKVRSIRVYSIFGEVKYESGFSNAIDISDIADGIYLLEIVTKDEERVVKKIRKGK